VIRDIDLELVFEGGNGQFGDNRYRSRWFDPILEDVLLNNEALPQIDYNERYTNGSTRDEGCDYLIVSPDGAEFQQWADTIRAFRTMQGINTKVVTLSEIGGNSPAILEAYFNDAYNFWDVPPAAVLLLGDYGTSMDNSITSPIWDGYCVSDNIFADVSGNSMPDMIFARITANNAAQLEVMITKFINYEKTPPTDPGFYNHPITALGWQTERWFQICSEAVGGYFKNVHGKDPVRINAVYGGNPNSDPWSTATNTSTVLNVFGPNGLGYIPASPSELGGWTGGTGAAVNNAINNGSFMLQHRDHGSETGWGEPDYGNSNINGLNNTDLTFIFSINCLTGKYNIGGECFAEKFHRYTSGDHNSGALGLIAASEVSYSFVNDTYVWGMYDNMWPDFMPQYGSDVDERGLLPSFGNAAGKYFLEQSGWPYNTNNKEVTYNLFHHHGGAFLTLYSEVPQDLTVMHDPILYSGTNFYTVTADEGAFVSLTVNGEIIGVGEGTGSPESITIEPQLPPNKLVVTITKTNYYRYSSEVEIIPPEGPYVVYNSYEIDDSQGNDDGQVDYGETIMLSVTARNVGVETASDAMVTLASADPYINITDPEENYGDIDPGGFVTVDNAFTFVVSDTIPDDHKILFDLVIKDINDSTWTTYFSISGHAPVLEVGNILIDGNGNGRLDPGETVDITITAYNRGSSDAFDVATTLQTTSGFLTINSASFEIGDISATSLGQSHFNVTVDAGAQIGSVVDMIYDAVSGLHSANKTFSSKVGLIVEDFESASFEGYDWSFAGNADWQISEDIPYEGVYCVKSGNIGNYQSTQLLLDYDVMADDSISFYYKVSSEASYDFLEFFIDNTKVGEWSGEIGWTKAAYAVTEGPHTFTWNYNKDNYLSTGGDCAWIDFVSLPPALTTTAYAGTDDDACEEDTYQLNGTATLYTEIEWTTSGTGYFDDISILNPVYTPGPEDVEFGSVTLTLTANAPTKGDASDDMVLTINKIPVISVSDQAAICAGEEYICTASAENYTSLMWTTDGDGTFDDPTLMNPVYTPGEEDIANAETQLTLTAYQTACNDASISNSLSINPLPTPQLSGDAMVCQGYEGYTYATPDVEGCNYLWEVTGGTIMEGQETSQVVIMWDNMGEGKVVLTETVSETLCAASVEMDITINATPTPQISGMDAVCLNSTDEAYSTMMVEGNTFDWAITGGTITAGQNTNEISVTWDETGEGMIQLTETITETGCMAVNTYDVTVNHLPIVELGEDFEMCHNHIKELDAGHPNAASWIWSTGETSQVITVDSTGVGFSGSENISVVVTDEKGCEGSSEVTMTIQNCTGIPESIYDLGINVFPNPNDGNFTLELNAEQPDEVRIKVVDARGAIVYSNERISIQGNHTMRISLNDLQEGMYYLMIDSDKVHQVKKIIVNK